MPGLSQSRLSKALAVAAASATAAFATAAPPAAAAAPPSITTSPATAAAGWLSQQLVGGNHLVFAFDGKTFDGGGTADLIYALAASKTGKRAIDAATAYFQTHVAEYTSITDTSGKPGPFDGAIAKTAVAAFVAGADPTQFGGHNLLRTLADDECTAVSGDPNDFTVPVCPAAGAGLNVFSSISESLIMLAEARGSRTGVSDAPSPAALAYFLSLQCPASGGFTTSTTGASPCTPDVDATSYALMALQAIGGHAAEINKAARYLQKTRRSNGAWSANGGDNVDSTGLAAAALRAAGRSTATSRGWLVSQQMTDGPTVGKGASRGALKFQGTFDPSSSVKGTSDGMLGLVAAGSLATLDASGATPGTAVLALDPPAVQHTSVVRGGSQTVVGTGFAAGEKVTGVLRSTPFTVGTATANAHGTATLSFTVPGSVSVGTHTLTLTGATSGLTSTVRCTVAALHATHAPIGSTSTSTSPALADTGRDARQTRSEVLAGVGLLALGAAVLVLGRRRVRHGR